MIGIELRNNATTTGWFHLVSSMYCVRRKMTNTEQIIPPMAQNIPSFNTEIDKQDKAANEPKINAKTVSTLPKLILFVC